MRIDDDTARAIGVALNESALLGANYEPERNVAVVTLSVLTLPDDDSPEPADPRRQIIFTNVGRIVAALRESRWDDLSADPVPFDIGELLTIVRSFDGQPIYGWNFVNHDDPAINHWKDRASVLVEPRGGSLENRISLFQEGATAQRILDLWIWFDGLIIRDALGNSIPLADFTAGGKRWWDALHAGDSRTDGHGIVPGG